MGAGFQAVNNYKEERNKNIKEKGKNCEIKERRTYLVKMIWRKIALFGALLLVCSVNGLNLGEYFEYDRETQLKNGEEESIFIKLASPVHFFSETYDNIYVSTNRTRNASQLLMRSN